MKAELLVVQKGKNTSICSGSINIGEVTYLNALAIYQQMTIDSCLAIYQ